MLTSFALIRRSIATMASEVLPSIPSVDVDPTGIFKYILVQLTVKEDDGSPQKKLLVRGYAKCNYHADINDEVTSELQKLKASGKIPQWSTKVLGGGRIILDSPNKVIKVYGYSQAYGKADHQTTVELLKTLYEDHDISWSDEGY